MTNRLKIKIAALIAVAAIGLVAMGALLTGMQTDMLVEGYQQEMDQEAAELPTLLQEAADETEQNTETFDAIYQSKAASVAFMANNNAGFEATNAKMAECRDLLGVSNVLVVNRAGDVAAQAAETRADFSHARFNQLRTTFATGEPSPAVDVELPEQNWDMRYYAAAIGDDTMVVVEQDPTELDELIEDTGSVAAVLKNISVGQHGYVFAVSARDYLIEYHPTARWWGPTPSTAACRLKASRTARAPGSTSTGSAGTATLRSSTTRTTCSPCPKVTWPRRATSPRA